ncbi:GIY-YIG nuclease family protein [Morganella morganii]|nr:GIY-YIG nuclease family protein [Morganella morganii]
MSGTTIQLNFDGYWRDDSISDTPNSSGIYCVYRGTRNTSVKPITVNLIELIYIGESGDVRKRLANHDKYDSWKRKLKKGEILLYSVAKVTTSKDDRLRAEATLINSCDPVINKEYTQEYSAVKSFPFNKTTVKTTGANSFLPSTTTAGDDD